jgi:hypothetical protein
MWTGHRDRANHGTNLRIKANCRARRNRFGCADSRVHNRYSAPVTFFRGDRAGRLAHRADALGMAI